MRYVWKSLQQIEVMLASSKHKLLLLDYDGTLSDIAKTPQKAIFPIKTKNLLINLMLIKSITIGIVSGRSIEDIKKHIGIPGIIYAGNHGLEWEINGRGYLVPPVEQATEMYEEIIEKFKEKLGNFTGAYVEDKKLSISIHYRMVDPNLESIFIKDFEIFIKKYLDAGLVKLSHGKKVFDIKPNIKWGKGNFVNWLIEKSPNYALAIYIGDDKTDEDVFRKVENALTIKVGNTKSDAMYFLDSPKDTVKFLEWLLQKCNEPL